MGTGRATHKHHYSHMQVSQHCTHHCSDLLGDTQACCTQLQCVLTIAVHCVRSRALTNSTSHVYHASHSIPTLESLPTSTTHQHSSIHLASFLALHIHSLHVAVVLRRPRSGRPSRARPTAAAAAAALRRSHSGGRGRRGGGQTTAAGKRAAREAGADAGGQHQLAGAAHHRAEGDHCGRGATAVPTDQQSTAAGSRRKRRRR